MAAMRRQSRFSRRTAARVTTQIVAAAMLAPHRARAQATPLPSQGDALPPETQLATLNLMTKALAEHQTPGAIVGVWAPGHGVAMIAAGLGELATATPIALDDHVRIASITKTFIATVVLQLVGEGKLGLEDRLGDYVEGIPNGAAITLRQMLGMRSGIFDYLGLPIISLAYTNNPTMDYTPEHALDVIRQRNQADFAPGASHRYSNSNYLLLGLILEHVTGQSLATLISDRIIAPLGLTGTSFPTSAELPTPFAHGYDAPAATAPLRDVSAQNPAITWAAGAMVSTLLDLKIWAGALATGALLTPELHAAQMDIATETTAAGTFGYGLGVLSVNGMVGHNGGMPGYRSWMLYDPETATTFVVITNRTGALADAAEAIVIGLGQLFLPERFTAPTPAAMPLASPVGERQARPRPPVASLLPLALPTEGSAA